MEHEGDGQAVAHLATQPVLPPVWVQLTVLIGQPPDEAAGLSSQTQCCMGNTLNIRTNSRQGDASILRPNEGK